MEEESHPQFGRPTIAVLSAKGGVGKSTVTAALGAALAEAGRQTLIVDCDPLNSSQAALWEPGPLPVDEDRALLRPSPTSIDGLMVLSPGQFLDASARADWEGRTKSQWLAFVAANTDLDGIDMVLLDLPAGGQPFLEDVYCYGKGTATGALLVVTGHRLVADATQRWKVGLNQAWERCPTVVVENQSHLKDGTRVIGSDEATAALSDAIGFECVAHLPLADDHLVLSEAEDTRRLAEVVLALRKPDEADEE